MAVLSTEQDDPLPTVASLKLTGPQKRILLVLCNRTDNPQGTYEPTSTCLRNGESSSGAIREHNTAHALIRKGLVKKVLYGRFKTTDEGYWLGDELRTLDAQGKIPARRSFRS